MDKKEITTILLASIILALTVSYKNQELIYASSLSFLIIILANVITKKIVGFHFETSVKTKFWTWQQFGLRQDMHFKNPLPMAWLPLALTFITKAHFFWLGILEFDIKAKTERVAKRHGLYRFTEVTEWHMALIALWGIMANLILAIFGYLTGFEYFTKLSIYYMFWSILPLARLDGAKIFYASRGLWITSFIITALIFILGLMI